MLCEVEYTDEFNAWWNTLDEKEQDTIYSNVSLLERKGVSLGYPYSSDVKSSKHSHMRELRIQHQGDAYRVLYAFDPRRIAILLIGGCKSGDDDWYKKYVTIADSIYDEHLIEIKEEE